MCFRLSSLCFLPFCEQVEASLGLRSCHIVISMCRHVSVSACTHTYSPRHTSDALLGLVVCMRKGPCQAGTSRSGNLTWRPQLQSSSAGSEKARFVRAQGFLVSWVAKPIWGPVCSVLTFALDSFARHWLSPALVHSAPGFLDGGTGWVWLPLTSLWGKVRGHLHGLALLWKDKEMCSLCLWGRTEPVSRAWRGQY